MKVLESVKQPGLYRLWYNRGKEVTEAVTYDGILKSIVDDEDWDPGIFKWISEQEINLEDWKEIEFPPLDFIN